MPKHLQTQELFSFANNEFWINFSWRQNRHTWNLKTTTTFISLKPLVFGSIGCASGQARHKTGRRFFAGNVCVPSKRNGRNVAFGLVAEVCAIVFVA